MNPAVEILGIIAGNRSLPLLFAQQARGAGVKRLVAVAFEGETDPAIAGLVDEVVWVKVGQLSKMIAAFADRKIRQCVMLGQVAPKNLYEVRPDLRAMAVLFRLKERNAHSIFGALAEELRKDGVELVEATPWLRPLMPGVGFRLGRKLSGEQQTDVDFGFRIAKEISRMEIGQTVVVKKAHRAGGGRLRGDGQVPGAGRRAGRLGTRGGGGQGGEAESRHALRRALCGAGNFGDLRALGSGGAGVRGRTQPAARTGTLRRPGRPAQAGHHHSQLRSKQSA